MNYWSTGYLPVATYVAYCCVYSAVTKLNFLINRGLPLCVWSLLIYTLALSHFVVRLRSIKLYL
jgi:hypothetical protein